MTFKTHQRFAVFWALLSVMLLYINDFMSINYYLALIIVIPFAKIGAMFPDLDHGWDNIREKNILKFAVNKAIHITGGRHRSWQTHSIDIVLIFVFLVYWLPGYLVTKGLIEVDLVTLTLVNIILVGFAIGWVSHLVADMLTAGKVRLISFLDIEVGLVPRKFMWFKFNTGGEWEEFVYFMTGFLNVFFTVLAIIYPLLVDVKL